MRKVIISIVLAIFTVCCRTTIFADSATQSGINYLGTQLNGATGQITGGSTGNASPWAAIAFSANGIDPATVKSSTHAPSLVDYLQSNPPTASSPATDWEKWMLAIVASGQNPYNFGGINYVATLESASYVGGSQIGDGTTATDDWFGVLALVASGVDTADPVLRNSVAFILAHQNQDGGYGYSTDPTVGSDGNDTAAAIQALVAAKNYGVAAANVDSAIVRAKTYLLSTQDASGGFLYDTNPWTTAPDTDSTTWALMALNVLGMQSSSQADSARAWLTASPQQSTTDGGFTACNQWDPSTFACTGVGSNSTTTSHALIGVAGKGWLLKIFNASSVATVSALPTALAVSPTGSPTSTPTPAPTDSPSVSLSTITPTPSPVLRAPTPTQVVLARSADSAPLPAAAVLGVATEKKPIITTSYSPNMTLFLMFLGLGSIGLLLYSWVGILRKKL